MTTFAVDPGPIHTTPPAKALPHLSLSSAFSRMYRRNRMQVFFSLVFPLLFLGMFAMIGAIAAAAPSVDILGDLEAVPTEALRTAGIGLEQSPTVESAIENLTSGQVLAVLDTDQRMAWVPEGLDDRAILDTIAAAGLQIVEVPSSEIFNFMRFGLPGVLTFATLNVAFFGTTTTLIEMRKQGVLNLLRRTPARTGQVILAPVPSKLVGFAGVLTLMIVLSWLLGYIDVAAVPWSIATGLISFTAAMTWAYLLGARSTNIELATAVTGGVLPVALMLSGALLPLEILPSVFERVAVISPIAHIASLYRAALTGTEPTWSPTLSVLVLAASAAVSIAVSIRIFRWR